MSQELIQFFTKYPRFCHSTSMLVPILKLQYGLDFSLILMQFTEILWYRCSPSEAFPFVLPYNNKKWQEMYLLQTSVRPVEMLGCVFPLQYLLGRKVLVSLSLFDPKPWQIQQTILLTVKAFVSSSPSAKQRASLWRMKDWFSEAHLT